MSTTVAQQSTACPPARATDTRSAVGAAAQPAARHGPRLGRILADVRASRAARFFGVTWLSAALVLVLTGQDFPFDGLLTGAVFLFLSLLTVAITQATQAVPAAAVRRPRLWLQVGLILVFVLLTAWRGLTFHRAIAPEASIPLWSPLVDALQRMGAEWFGNITYVANPVMYVLLPLLVLLLAGASLRSLGFGRGHRVGRVLLLWCALPVLFFAYFLLAGQLTVERLAGRFLANSLSNGFFEEFLFRGALQTRLRPLVGPSSAVVVQALVFGAWHLGLGFTNTDHAGWLPALASTLANQAIVGLAYGIVFERTRNLLAPSAIHVLVDSMWS